MKIFISSLAPKNRLKASTKIYSIVIIHDDSGYLHYGSIMSVADRTGIVSSKYTTRTTPSVIKSHLFDSVFVNFVYKGDITTTQPFSILGKSGSGLTCFHESFNINFKLYEYGIHHKNLDCSEIIAIVPHYRSPSFFAIMRSGNILLLRSLHLKQEALIKQSQFCSLEFIGAYYGGHHKVHLVCRNKDSIVKTTISGRKEAVKGVPWSPLSMSPSKDKDISISETGRYRWNTKYIYDGQKRGERTSPPEGESIIQCLCCQNVGVFLTKNGKVYTYTKELEQPGIWKEIRNPIGKKLKINSIASLNDLDVVCLGKDYSQRHIVLTRINIRTRMDNNPPFISDHEIIHKILRPGFKQTPAFTDVNVITRL